MIAITTEHRGEALAVSIVTTKHGTMVRLLASHFPEHAIWDGNDETAARDFLIKLRNCIDAALNLG